MASSATSLQNPLPWFFIQIKLHSAKQNKKYQPCVVVSDPWQPIHAACCTDKGQTVILMSFLSSFN